MNLRSPHDRAFPPPNAKEGASRVIPQETREPLPYRHEGKRSRLSGPPACTRPEDDRASQVSLECPGCTVHTMALVLKRPDRSARYTTGKQVSPIDAIRSALDDFDPIRVLFERALRERGLSLIPQVSASLGAE